MSDSSTIQRLEDLEAGRILGDLSEDEWQELEELSKKHHDALDGSLEWAAAQLEASLAGNRAAEKMPADLSGKVRAGTADFVTDSADEKVTPISAGWWKSAPAAWAVAAVLTVLLALSWLIEPETGSGFAGIDSAPDRIESPFAGVDEPYATVSGAVIWSDELQEGYMRLENMPVNDPAEKQYQLWIVDPSRDEAPVDGGVFDIAEDGTVRIPIDAKLRVDDPKAFLITLEKPGGVVKSSQDVKVALATPS
ncbi:MAG: anti-sigma factor [Verrucomicrobiales bacterium]|nr:anti-sigma factor [Verrucomicrobiales bacterium]